MDAATTGQLQNVADDLSADVKLVRDAITAYKTGGKTALIQTLSGAIPLVEKEYADVQAALPTIKAGYKTTEFWLIVGTMLINGGYLAATGKAVPLDVNALLGALVGVYTVVRGLVKGTPAANTTPAK